MARFCQTLGFALLVAVAGFGFCLFGWTAANLANPCADLPDWLWTGSFSVAALGCFLSTIVALFAALDR